MLTKKSLLDAVMMPTYGQRTICLQIAEITKGFYGDTITASWSALAPVQLGINIKSCFRELCSGGTAT
jgi:hypothetical protein